jgi:hypothetical protein
MISSAMENPASGFIFPPQAHSRSVRKRCVFVAPGNISAQLHMVLQYHTIRDPTQHVSSFESIHGSSFDPDPPAEPFP